MDQSDKVLTDEADLAPVSSDAEATAVRIVSNLPEGRLGSPNGVQAERSGALLGGLHDGDRHSDMSQLEEDLAELEEELDLGAWDHMRGASLICSI